VPDNILPVIPIFVLTAGIEITGGYFSFFHQLFISR